MGIVSGNWGEIEYSGSEKITPPQRLQILWNALKTLVVAVLPAFILLGFQRTEFALKPPVSEYLTLGVLFWAILGILNSFDPTSSQRIISQLKDITDIASSIPGLDK